MGISAQELRIGNYINGSIGDDSELVLCSVTGYDPRDEFIFVSNDNNIHYAEFVDFQPIPLTEERLLKLPKNVTIPSHVIYVHQLQNWFFFNFNKELS